MGLWPECCGNAQMFCRLESWKEFESEVDQLQRVLQSVADELKSGH